MSDVWCQRPDCFRLDTRLDANGRCPRCGYDYAAPLPVEVRRIMAQVLGGKGR